MITKGSVIVDPVEIEKLKAIKDKIVKEQQTIKK
jgi:hypothetical protein